MNPLQRPLCGVVFTALLLGALACSDKKGTEKLGLASQSGADQSKEKRDQLSGSARQPLAARVKDVAISARVKVKILRERVLRTSDINVATRNRVVVLTGTVEKPEYATRAIQIAQSVNDVDRVDNQLAVRSGS